MNGKTSKITKFERLMRKESQREYYFGVLLGKLQTFSHHYSHIFMEQ
jgi:hypothetical protein